MKEKFSKESDVWSLGVFLWEVFSNGDVPYIGMSNREVILWIVKSEANRLEKPTKCPSNVYLLMRKCWASEPKNRPSLIEIHKELSTALEIATKAKVNVNVNDEGYGAFSMGDDSLEVTPKLAKPLPTQTVPPKPPLPSKVNTAQYQVQQIPPRQQTPPPQQSFSATENPNKVPVNVAQYQVQPIPPRTQQQFVPSVAVKSQTPRGLVELNFKRGSPHGQKPQTSYGCAACFTAQGSLLLIGGCSVKHDRVYEYSFKQEQWSIFQTPTEEEVLSRGKSSFMSKFKKEKVLEKEESSLVKISTGPQQIFGHTATSSYYGGCIVVVGGKPHKDAIHVLNTQTKSWHTISKTSGTWPQARHYPSIIKLPQSKGGKIIMFGGDTDTYVNDLWTLDFDIDWASAQSSDIQWKQIRTSGDKPSGRYGNVSAIVQDSSKADILLIHGGYDAAYLGEDGIYECNLTTKVWKKTLPPQGKLNYPTKRCLHYSFLVPKINPTTQLNELLWFIYGGWDNQDDWYCYHYAQNKWIKVETPADSSSARSTSSGEKVTISGSLPGKRGGGVFAFNEKNYRVCFTMGKGPSIDEAVYYCDL